MARLQTLAPRPITITSYNWDSLDGCTADGEEISYMGEVTGKIILDKPRRARFEIDPASRLLDEPRPESMGLPKGRDRTNHERHMGRVMMKMMRSHNRHVIRNHIKHEYLTVSQTWYALNSTDTDTMPVGGAGAHY